MCSECAWHTKLLFVECTIMNLLNNAREIELWASLKLNLIICCGIFNFRKWQREKTSLYESTVTWTGLNQQDYADWINRVHSFKNPQRSQISPVSPSHSLHTVHNTKCAVMYNLHTYHGYKRSTYPFLKWQNVCDAK